MKKRNVLHRDTIDLSFFEADVNFSAWPVVVAQCLGMIDGSSFK